MKRVVFALLAFALLASLTGILGCTSQSTPSPSPTTAKPTSPSPTTAKPTTTQQAKPQIGSIVWQTQTSQLRGVPTVDVLEEFGKKVSDYVSQRYDGSFKLEVFPSQGLGYALNDVWKVTSGGQMVFGESSAPVLATRFPGIDVLDLPVLTPDKNPQKLNEIAKAIFNTVAEEILKENLVLLLYVPLGSGRSFDTTKMPPNLNDPKAPLKGLKIRTSTKVSIFGVEVLGGTAVQMDFGEVYTSLERGIIDGHDFGTAITATVSTRVAEFAKYKYNMEFGDSTWVWIANKTAFEALPKDVQSYVKEAAQAAQSILTERYNKANADAWPKVRDEFKHQYVEPTPETIAWVQSQVKTYYDTWLGSGGAFGKKLLDAAQAKAKELYK